MYSFVSRKRCASLLYQLAFCKGLAVLFLHSAAVPGAWERNLQKVLQMTVRKNISLPPAATHV